MKVNSVWLEMRNAIISFCFYLFLAWNLVEVALYPPSVTCWHKTMIIYRELSVLTWSCDALTCDNLDVFGNVKEVNISAGLRLAIMLKLTGLVSWHWTRELIWLCSLLFGGGWAIGGKSHGANEFWHGLHREDRECACTSLRTRRPGWGMVAAGVS